MANDTPAAGSPTLAGPHDEDVARFLRDNPDFLTERADLLDVLVFPSRWSGDRIVDLQQRMVERLRGEIDNLRGCAMDLIDTSRNNMANLTRTHSAVLALLCAENMKDLGKVVAEQLPLLLDVDAVGLAFEPSDEPSLSAPPIRPLPEGWVAQMLPDGRDVVLVRALQNPELLFGTAVPIASAAVARLRAEGNMPRGVFVLGAREEGTFHPGQGTELLSFVARVMERCLRRCLAAPF